jgi:hypothetical protein
MQVQYFRTIAFPAFRRYLVAVQVPKTDNLVTA